MNFHSMTPNEALRSLGSDSEGLSRGEAARRLEHYGENRLSEKKEKSLLRRFFSQFADFMVLVLLAAAAVSFVTSLLEGERDLLDPVIILIIVTVNAIVGTVQESRAMRALEKLRELSAPEARVFRKGRETTVHASEIVPGDILVLHTGDRVAADARLIQSVNLKLGESALTGESIPSEKDSHLVLPQEIGAGDMKNCVFASTVVLEGHARAVAYATGMNTQIGKIADLLNSGEAPQTPLQQRLEKLGKILGTAALSICVLIFIVGLLRKMELAQSFMLSVSLAVAAIPEGLPAIVTVVLSVGVQRMAKKRAIVRRLPCVEALGSATCICSDKTGTLTLNRMEVKELCAPFENTDAAGKLLELASLCCNALPDGRGGADGEPTENAIIVAAVKRGVYRREGEGCKRLREIPFNSSAKLMSVAVRCDGEIISVTKGAPEVLLDRCDYITLPKVGDVPLTSEMRMKIENKNARLAENALRVIAVASGTPESVFGELQRGLVFKGLIGMIDPPRKQAKPAVETCGRAGITPVMITGDHASTALAIARELGIDISGGALTGAQLDSMDDEKMRDAVKKCRVFARVSPEHKVRIVTALRDNGEIVAMTGDGVNDAPALKAADIGCAMGKSGTDVAKGAADIVLADDNFATIVNAVREGRGIYSNIQKAVHFLLSSNIGEILLILIAVLSGLPAPLVPIQLLWVNLVTDSLPAMALGVEGIERDVMERPPIPPGKGLFADGLWLDILLEGAIVGLLSLLAFVLGQRFFDPPGEYAMSRTMAFCVLSLSELVHAFNTRSRVSLFKIGAFSNMKMNLAFLICLALQTAVVTVPALNSVFSTAPLGTYGWLVVAALSLAILPLVEIGKAIERFAKKT